MSQQLEYNLLLDQHLTVTDDDSQSDPFNLTIPSFDAYPSVFALPPFFSVPPPIYRALRLPSSASTWYQYFTMKPLSPDPFLNALRSVPTFPLSKTECAAHDYYVSLANKNFPSVTPSAGTENYQNWAYECVLGLTSIHLISYLNCTYTALAHSDTKEFYHWADWNEQIIELLLHNTSPSVCHELDLTLHSSAHNF
ncbi:hypothetical protein EW146_g6146 [Bondarzewia mesenterica]|uniref:Uncharacterized protein n=1 Tax=Bondarzewia mesenterica TaxID=1095465 RepID=A0A4S4LPH1_9AGAM|nr:hypothetical protein EW146_g6146 [Bondarzewia mesenterica]